MTTETTLKAPRAASSFLAMSLLFLGASTLWIAIQPTLFVDPANANASRAWLYLTLYGFLLPATFGLIYRALPMAYDTPLLSENLIPLHLAFHMFGFGIVIAHAINPEGVSPVMGTTFLACGVVIFLVNTGHALNKRGLAEPSSAFLAASLVWLAISSLLGLPLSNSPAFPTLQETQWSAATLELCLLGFVTNAILGLALRFTSLRLANDPPRTDSSWFSLFITNAGLAWLFGAITYGPAAYALLCAAIYLSGLLVYLARYMAITQQRRVEVLDWDTKLLLTALWVLPAAALLAGWSAWIRMGNPEQPPSGLDTATALTAILAAATPALIALFYQSEAILRRFNPDEPTAHLRLSSQILLASFFNYATGVCLLLGGAGVVSEKMTALGALFTLVGVLGFTGNLIFLGKEPPSPAPAPTPTTP
jgi:hypothetical protein